jgi:hypothetical protein
MDAEHYISYLREEVNHEITRLKAALRSPQMTEEEREVARAMLGFYEDARMTQEESFLLSMEGIGRTRGGLGSIKPNESGKNASRKKARAA